MPTDATFILAGLFVVAAAAGWAFARFGGFREREGAEAPISADYLRGLNLVLDRQTDEALELFVRMAKVDSDTLETHFALGQRGPDWALKYKFFTTIIRTCSAGKWPVKCIRVIPASLSKS